MRRSIRRDPPCFVFGEQLGSRIDQANPDGAAMSIIYG
jgi:hypothetical protein